MESFVQITHLAVAFQQGGVGDEVRLYLNTSQYAYCSRGSAQYEARVWAGGRRRQVYHIIHVYIYTHTYIYEPGPRTPTPPPPPPPMVSPPHS